MISQERKHWGNREDRKPHHDRQEWGLRQFVAGIETRLRIGDIREQEARIVMGRRLVPQHVQDRIIDRVGMPT